jgi:hypothetical protein
VADAHAAGIKVLTHTVTLDGAKIAARAGVDVLAHGIGDAAVDQELIGILKAKRTTYVPTLAVYETHQLSRVTPRALAVLDADAREVIARAAAIRWPRRLRRRRDGEKSRSLSPRCGAGRAARRWGTYATGARWCSKWRGRRGRGRGSKSITWGCIRKPGTSGGGSV